MSINSYIYKDLPTQTDSDLFFTFHGTGGDENQFLGLARELLPQAHVISPRGDVSEHGALRFFKRTGEGIYDMADLDKRTAHMGAFIAAHKAKLMPKRVIALGYSNGANILASVMFAHAGLIDVAVLMHPLIPFAPPPRTDNPRVLVTAGRRDPICPALLTEKLIMHFDAEAYWHDGGHEVRPGEIDAISAFLK